MTGKRGLLWLVAGIALALLAGRWLAGLYGDWAFYHALDADAVWRAALATQVVVRATVFALVFAFAFANFFAVRQSIISLELPRHVGNLEIRESIPTRRLTTLAAAGAVLLAALFTLVRHDWTMVYQAVHGLPFGEIDPYFDRDLSFYVHWLPLERALNSLVSVLVLLVSAIVVALYATTPSVRWDVRGLYVSTWVRRHLGVLGGVAIGLVAWDWRLDRFALLTQGHGEGQFITEAPFGVFDHRVLVPYLLLASFAAIPVAVVFAWALWRGYLRLGLALVTVMIVGGPITRIALPLVAKPPMGTREAIARDRPYAATRVLYTRRAFGVDAIARGSSAASPATARGQATDSAGPVMLGTQQLARWVSSWDPAALVRSVEAERGDADVSALAWRSGDNGLEATLLQAPRQPTAPGTRWLAERVRVTEVNLRGLPPSVAGAVGFGVSGVLVAPGASRYALVADSTGRIAAAPFETTLQRVAHAWDQQNPRLLAVDAPMPRPRIMTHRDAAERVAQLVPFLRLGGTVTPVVRRDSLYWALELFAVAKEYPLSVPLSFAGVRAHYVSHAATALVHAQTGVVTLLAVDAPDAVTRGWMRRFPGLFTPRSELPPWLASALPPAVDWALVQGAMLGRTGFLGDSALIRSLARVDDADADLAGGPVTLFQSDSAGVLAWGIPVLDGTQDLSGLLTARGGRAPRTEFTPLTPGRTWTQTLEELQFAADGAGFGRALSNSRRGRVQAIPTESGPAFVQSFYEWPADASPRLAGVAVLSGERAFTGRTLGDALGLAPERPVVASEAFRARVQELYETMDAALRSGDWRGYGEAWGELGRLLGVRPTGDR